MIRHSAWQEDGPVGEAPERARVAANRLWSRQISGGSICLTGFNTDEIYTYTVCALCNEPKEVAGAVRTLFAKAPGSVKEIQLQLYSHGEITPFDSIKASCPPSELKTRVKALDQAIQQMVFRQLDPNMKEKVSGGKELVVEYDITIKFLILSRRGSAIILDTWGAFLLDLEDRTIAFAKSLGEVKGCEVQAVEEVEIDDIDETPEEISLHVIPKPQ